MTSLPYQRCLCLAHSTKKPSPVEKLGGVDEEGNKKGREGKG